MAGGYPDANPSRETRYQDIRLYGRTLTAEEVERLPFEDYVAEVAAKPMDKWNTDEAHAVNEFYFDHIDQTAKRIMAQIDQLDAQLIRLSEGGDLTLVSWEKPSLAYANVLTRGVYTARTDRVEANTPHYLPPLPANEPHDRLALAKWTVSAENPLTARVTVNRMWNEVFGAGLVETTEDFGIMGQRPSHPELLDWLAVEFRQSGWNIKHMYKLMVMSAAYRAKREVDAPAACQRSEEPAACAWATIPHGCGDVAGRGVAVERPAGQPDWGAKRQDPTSPRMCGSRSAIGGSDTLAL